MQFTIEKLIYGGDGLARIPAQGDERRGKTIFVPYVLPAERVEAELIEERKGFARASLVQVLEPAPSRIQAPCPHFGRCGGCHYQHAAYPAQLEAKRQILAETILRGAKLELPEIQLHSGPEYGFRNRARMKFAFEPAFAIGYHRHGSHELEAVRHCPISSPLINRALALLWELAPEAAQYPDLREVQFFANHDDSELLIELSIHHTAVPAALEGFAKLLRLRLAELCGVAIFASGSGRGEDEDSGGDIESIRRLSRAGAPFLEGAGALTYKVEAHGYRVSAGSFFQTNRHLTAKLVELVTSGREGRAALDLFAGVGLFTLPLAKCFERVTAVEIAPSSSLDLALNAASPHIRTFQSTTEDFLRSARGRWDFAVIDPPRAGLGERAARSLASLAIPRLAYVACDPATLARDLVVLAGAGYHVEQAHLVDLFPQTYHLETVLHLSR